MIRQILVKSEKSREMLTPMKGMNVFSSTVKASSASPAFGVRSSQLGKKKVHFPRAFGNGSPVMDFLISGINVFFSPFASSTLRGFSERNSATHSAWRREIEIDP